MDGEQVRNSEADVFVHWKGTDLCMDFQCVCSDPEDAYEFHFDGYGTNRFRCPRCGKEWALWVMAMPYVQNLDEFGKEPSAKTLERDDV